MSAFVSAGAGFLLAVLWFDLMFDVQARGPRDHVLPALCPPYASIPVLGGAMALGTWQSVCLVDLNGDNPRRQVRLSFLAG